MYLIFGTHVMSCFSAMDSDDKDIMRLRKRKQRTKHIILEWDTYKYWQKFGLDHGMVTDSEVAVFLLQL